LASRGNDVTVISGAPNINKTVVEEVNKVEVVRIPTYAPREAYHLPKDKQTVMHFLGDQPDIVHAHSVHAAISLLPLKIKKLTKPNWKLVMTLHFSTPGYTFLRRAIWKLAWRRYVDNHLRYVDLIHATSPLEASIISKYFPNIKEKIVTIPIGVDEDVLNYQWKGRNSDYLLFSGRLERYKRVDVAVKAVSLLVRQGYSLRLVVTGSGPYKREIIRKAKRELGEAADRFVLVDSPKPRREYLELLSNARAAISLSAAENFNIFLAEAYMMGVPIIATCEAAAFCTRLANVKALAPDHVADAISKVLWNCRSADTVCKLRTWHEAVDEFENTYRSLVNSKYEAS